MTPPSSTALPTIDGTADVGQALHANPGSWTGFPAPTFSYQWQDCTATAYRDAVLADSPLGYWRLGEGAPSTTAFDESANHSNGTYLNAPTFGQPGLLTDDESLAVDFNGSNQSVTTSVTSTTAQLAQFTFESWIQTSGTKTTRQAIIGNSVGGLEIAANASNVRLQFSNGSTTQTVTAPAVVTDGRPHHVVGTWDGSQLRIYVDNSAPTVATPVGTPVGSTTGIAIGNYTGVASAN
ncbi:MAG: LamG domain-containing protein, partial [Actinobacteria bacterium]